MVKLAGELQADLIQELEILTSDIAILRERASSFPRKDPEVRS